MNVRSVPACDRWHSSWTWTVFIWMVDLCNSTIIHFDFFFSQSCWQWGWGFYLQRVCSISLRMYVIWNRQLTHSNKDIIFVYFESRVVSPTVLNRRILLTTFVSWPWFSFYCWYCRQHMTFARILHYLFIFNYFSDCLYRDCTQRKLEYSATTVTILSQFKLGSLPTKLLRYITGTIPPHIGLSNNKK